MNNGIYSLETEVEGSKVKEVARGRRKSKRSFIVYKYGK
jgi:hypothetical protein